MTDHDPEDGEEGGGGHGPASDDEGVPVRVNGRERRIPSGWTASDLLGDLELDPREVVVEVNRDIVRREALDETTLQAGDRVEIVRFVGGGRPTPAEDEA